MPRLTLYNYWRSSSSHRVRIALAYKGLEYAYVPVNLAAGEQSGSAHATRSPTGYVPCLAVDGVTYVESVAILELLEELSPRPPLYPSDAHGRARVRALVEIVNSGIQPLQNMHVLGQLDALAGGAPDARTRWLGHFLGRGLAAFERAMGLCASEGVAGPYSYGAAPTAADVMLVPQVVAARRFHIDLAPYPRVVAAFEAAMQLEAFQKAAPEAQPDAPRT
jgi:maleylacetoacetate isomerase